MPRNALEKWKRKLCKKGLYCDSLELMDINEETNIERKIHHAKYLPKIGI